VWRTLLRPHILDFDGLGSLRTRSVQLCTIDAGVVGTNAAESSGECGAAAASTLDGERLAHNRAATTENLEVRHATSPGGNIVAGSRGGERAEGGGGGLREERAHGPRLAQKSLHIGQWRIPCVCKTLWCADVCGCWARREMVASEGKVGTVSE
jgi:hypothetical protein